MEGGFDLSDPLEQWYTAERPNRAVTPTEFKSFLGKVADAEFLGGLTHGEYAKLLVTEQGYSSAHTLATLDLVPSPGVPEDP